MNECHACMSEPCSCLEDELVDEIGKLKDKIIGLLDEIEEIKEHICRLEVKEGSA